MAMPELLMLDEPSLGLAPKLVQELFDIVRKIHERGTSILLVEQNVFHALSISDRAYVIENGRVTLEGKGEELLKNKDVEKAYLGI
jgi:branched-chain amino acid transport system ATP-binding protein